MASLSLVVALALVATPATSPPKPGQNDGDQKIVCRLTTEAGSRIPIRICRTAAEWERMAKENQDDWTSSRNSRTVGCNQLNCV
jgi:hypothetical protein